MRIKKYVADTMPEALKLVKADLGPQAVILNTRTLRKSGALGLREKRQVEVTAAVDDRKKSGGRRVSGSRGGGKGRPADRPTPAAAKVPTPPSRPSVPQGTGGRPAPSGAKWADRISRQIEALQASLQSVVHTRESGIFLPGALGALARQMEEAGLSRPIAESTLKAILLDPGEAGLKEIEPLQDRAVQILTGRFHPIAPTRLASGVRTVVALVGPAGAGKTTASARIAAHFVSEEGARAAFIAADTDRVGGLEQLRAYAGILGVPVDIVYTPEEMREAILTRRDVDLILIDTAGAGPLAAEQIGRLSAQLREAGPSEIHLVLSVVTDLQQMFDVAKAYSKVGADRLLLTKLDETGRLGAACALAVESGFSLSYTTDGRAVPGNLHPADPEALVRALFSRRPDGAAG